MIKINEVYFDPIEVVSIEPHIVKEYNSPSISDCSVHKTFDGVKVILRNGRKIYIDKISAKDLANQVMAFKKVNG